MNTIRKIIFCSLTSLILSTNADAFVREWGLGGSAIYNYTVNGVGFGFRAHLNVGERFTIAPQFAYYPAFNQFNDLYTGMSLHYNFTPTSKWGFYGLAAASYNLWVNYDDSYASIAKPNNYALEPGGGCIKNYGCIRPFFESRYNVNWGEGNARLGIMVFFSSCGGGGHGICPAYH